MFTDVIRILIPIIYFIFCFSAKAAEPKVDFNGDGRADLFLQNFFSGEISAWLIGSNGVISIAPFGTVAPSGGWVPLGLSDFNGDGRSDVFWRNNHNGELYVWLMDGGNILQTGSLGSVDINSGWLPIDLKDLNGDGRTDIFWRNSITGELYVWLINGTHILQTGSIGTVNPSSGWMPIDSKDFNGDGRSDVLWRNNNGELYVWLINGNQILQAGSLGTVPPASGWLPIGLNDFNGDGRTDIFWRNSITGELYVWLINGSKTMQAASLGSIDPASGWQPIDLKDFNGDGRADVFWQHNSGEFYVWLIDGLNILQGGSVGTEDPNSHSGWTPIGMDDFNGDGRADLFWRNSYTDETRAWLMNGSGIPQIKSYANVPTSSVWQVLIPH